MKLSLKSDEHLRVSHDGKLGFLIWVEDGFLHIRAKDAAESEPGRTTLVVDVNITLEK